MGPGWGSPASDEGGGAASGKRGRQRGMARSCASVLNCWKWDAGRFYCVEGTEGGGDSQLLVLHMPSGSTLIL